MGEEGPSDPGGFDINRIVIGGQAAFLQFPADRTIQEDAVVHGDGAGVHIEGEDDVAGLADGQVEGLIALAFHQCPDHVLHLTSLLGSHRGNCNHSPLMSLDLVKLLDGAVVMAPMTKGSNLPYRRLCDQLGATITMGEMALSRKLRKRSRPEFALIRRSEDEKVFGVQLAGRDPEEMAWAAALAEERGADLVDVNLGCPIDDMTRRGLGSALLRKPRKVESIVSAMKAAVKIPVTVKIRLAWEEGRFVHVKIAQAAVAGGADAVFVHGRTRQSRYRRPADWERIGEVVEAIQPVPVVGNGDILFPHEIEEARRRSGCAGVMIARGALIKPWIFAEAQDGQARDPDPEERLDFGRRYVALAKEHWGDDAGGIERLRGFLLWHLDFWCRFVPRCPDGAYPKLQERNAPFEHRSELEALLARPDPAAHGWIADLLIHGEERAGSPPPEPENGTLEASTGITPSG